MRTWTGRRRNERRSFHERLKGGSVRLAAIVDRLFENAVVSVTQVKDAFEVTYPTARADLRKLEGLGILQPLREMSQITHLAFCRSPRRAKTLARSKSVSASLSSEWR